MGVIAICAAAPPIFLVLFAMSDSPFPRCPSRVTDTPPTAAALDHAVRLARMGYKVFPANPETEFPLSRASNDERIVARAFRKYPNALVGIPTGLESGIVAISVKGRDGFAGLHRLASTGFTFLYGAPQVRTASGELLIFFRCPPRGVKSFSGVFPGISLKSDGDYVIWPHEIAQ
jgi:hypothetical protein